MRTQRGRVNASGNGFVSYCPGDAPGSRAGMWRWEAERYLREDTEFLSAINDVCAQVRNWPHIGGHCERCRRVGL